MHIPRPPNVPLLRALWSLLNGIWGVLKGSWGVHLMYIVSTHTLWAPKNLDIHEAKGIMLRGLWLKTPQTEGFWNREA